ncbi:MAG: ATP-binding protein [Siculibacillus sp.]|nr:ATP-binding protein [Siculibacillus sp.]
MISRIAECLRSSLAARLAVTLVAQLVVISGVFLSGFVALYRSSLQYERTRAAEKVGELLQASLENAMLKRDIDGLRQIVDRLGGLDDIVTVMILDPRGEVRFSSRHERLGSRFDIAAEGLCPDCRGPDGNAVAGGAFMRDAGREILRSVKPVANQPICGQCHGAVAEHPINGILVVDHAAEGLRREAALSAALFAGSGGVVLLTLVLATWFMLRRGVTEPVARLAGVARSLEAGDLQARVGATGPDEIGELGRSFDRVADRLVSSLAVVQEREDFLQAVLDAVPDGIRVIDEDFRVIRANRAYCAQAGLTPAEVVGRSCHAISHGRSEPCVPTLVTCPLVELQEPGARVKFHDRHVAGPDEEVAVEVVAAALTLADHQGVRRVVVEAIRDLEAMAQISHEQKLSEIDQLATGVAHEIRNPLSSIGLGLRAALGDIEQGEVSEAAMALRLIEPEIERCLGITSSLLRLSAPTGSHLDLVTMDQVIRDVVSLLHYEAERLNVEIELRLEPELRVIASDSEMRMVVINLAQNAVHAMPNGGRLRIEAVRGGSTVIVEVSDTGVGIRPEDIDRIFMPFWSRRADGVRGTGLGLAICRSIVRRVGGTLTVSSTLGQGSRFTLRMPDADHRTVD